MLGCRSTPFRNFVIGIVTFFAKLISCPHLLSNFKYAGKSKSTESRARLNCPNDGFILCNPEITEFDYDSFREVLEELLICNKPQLSGEKRYKKFILFRERKLLRVIIRLMISVYI